MKQIQSKPNIGLTPDIDDQHPPEQQFVVRRNYTQSIERADGLPLILPYSKNAEQYLSVVDGLVVSGGFFDIPTDLYEGKPQSGIITKPERTAFEQDLLRGALALDMPILGICNGLQLLAVTLGGKLVQNISTEVPNAIDHNPKVSAAVAHHRIDVVGSSRLATYASAGSYSVNSVHNQAVLANSNYSIVAKSPDGVTEAIEAKDHRFCLGVQWHPEYLVSDLDRAIWTAFCAAASQFGRSRSA